MTLINGLLVFLGISVVAALGITGVTFMLGVIVNKLAYDLPWMKWLTLKDVINMGYWAPFCRFALATLYEIKYLEVRLLDEHARRLERPAEIPEGPYETTYFRFKPDSIQYYEFRRINQGGRKKELRIKISLNWLFQPITA